MNIQLDKIGKKFAKNWIFRNLSADIRKGEKWAITGNNGSGKSTLIKLIAGYITPTKGNIYFSPTVEIENIYKNTSICAPYLELVEEMTCAEAIDFHVSYQRLQPSISKEKILDILDFDNEKYISDYSSGMKQRLKLALAFFSDTKILLLDEPTTNLDEDGFKWYIELIEKYALDRTVIIASNDKREYSFAIKPLK